ncbi:MAG TPA: energy transducer TonB [Chitinophagaceae bacterium]|nr:energy transducer TonB [Chitinophagaceae bacterium]
MLNKLLILISLIPACLVASAQDTLFRYFNKDWQAASRDSASYYAAFLKKGDVYECTTYHAGTRKIKGEGTVKDTSFTKIVGWFREYNDKGFFEDSMLFDESHQLQAHYRFRQNGKLHFKYHKNNKGKETIDAYDQAGSPVKNFVYLREAYFKGGEKAWQTYIKKNVNSSLKVKNIQSGTQATVIVQFIINKQGGIMDVKIKESSGYDAVDKDALRVVRAGPPWEPALLYNEPVNVYRQQPVTYILTSEKAN